MQDIVQNKIHGSDSVHYEIWKAVLLTQSSIEHASILIATYRI